MASRSPASSPGLRDAVLVYNPIAGRGRSATRLRPIVEELTAGGFRIEAVATTAPGDATRIAREAAAAGVAAVFALGGDGTLRETAAGLLGSRVALGPIPAGTANVVARALGIPTEPLAAARAVAGGAVSEQRIGLCGGEPFLMQASTGLDARVLASLKPETKRRLGHLGIGLATLREWWHYDYPEIRLAANGGRFCASFCAACNIPDYGPFRLAPVDAANGRLALVLFEGRGKAETLAFAIALARQRHLERADVRVEQVREVEIQGPPGLPLQLDGCVTGITPPVTIGLAPERLAVLSPRAAPRRPPS